MARIKAQPKRLRRRAYEDPKYEACLLAAAREYQEGHFRSICAAAKAHQVGKSTLGDRIRRKHKSAKVYSQSRQALTPEQEQVVVGWAALQVQSATPLGIHDIICYARDICKKGLGRNWLRAFFSRHPELILQKPVKLDPKRRDNFNKTVINQYFDAYKDLHRTYNSIPPEHIWTMDEKGIQMGGGQKGNGRKYIYLRSTKNRYRVTSDNLELVTIIECISAAGDTIPPSLILNEGRTPDIRDTSLVGIALLAACIDPNM